MTALWKNKKNPICYSEKNYLQFRFTLEMAVNNQQKKITFESLECVKIQTKLTAYDTMLLPIYIDENGDDQASKLGDFIAPTGTNTSLAVKPTRKNSRHTIKQELNIVEYE